MLQNREKYLAMIDEVLEEPNNLSKEWAELLSDVRRRLFDPAVWNPFYVGGRAFIAVGGQVIEARVEEIRIRKDGLSATLGGVECESGCDEACGECAVYEWYSAHAGDWNEETKLSEAVIGIEDVGVSVFADKEEAEAVVTKTRERGGRTDGEA